MALKKRLDLASDLRSVLVTPPAEEKAPEVVIQKEIKTKSAEKEEKKKFLIVTTNAFYEELTMVASEHGLNVTRFIMDNLARDINWKDDDIINTDITSQALAMKFAIHKVSNWCKLPTEYRTERILDAVLVRYPDALNIIFRFLPSELRTKFSKESWVKLCSKNLNAIRYVPEEYLPDCYNEIRK